jgi:hypothetical protein
MRQFYRIHVGIQSPEGVSSSHGVLKRFSDFLNLHASVSNFGFVLGIHFVPLLQLCFEMSIYFIML